MKSQFHSIVGGCCLAVALTLLGVGLFIEQFGNGWAEQPGRSAFLFGCFLVLGMLGLAFCILRNADGQNGCERLAIRRADGYSIRLPRCRNIQPGFFFSPIVVAFSVIAIWEASIYFLLRLKNAEQLYRPTFDEVVNNR